MPSSRPEPVDPLREAAEALAGEPVRSLAPVRRSGNSRVFRVESAAGAFALKLYPPRNRDARDRLGAEAAALAFMRVQGFDQVPRSVATDPARNATLLEWIEGEPISPATQADVDAALAFLRRLHAARSHSTAGSLASASEACLSAAELERQVEHRRARLVEAGRDQPALAEFLDARFLPTHQTLTATARDHYARAGLVWDSDIEPGRRTLSPSDFGFHNALRRPGGALAFLDFEYFGWDDPAKLVCDVLLHPGMDLPAGLKFRFLDGTRALYGNDPTLAARLEALYPLFGLRWCAILLNEFLPEKWTFRAHAGEPDPLAAQARQLAKAETLLQRLTHDDPIGHALKS
jgi:hypothetical protein